jgi:hypothetical protein
MISSSEISDFQTLNECLFLILVEKVLLFEHCLDLVKSRKEAFKRDRHHIQIFEGLLQSHINKYVRQLYDGIARRKAKHESDLSSSLDIKGNLARFDTANDNFQSLHSQIGYLDARVTVAPETHTFLNGLWRDCGCIPEAQLTILSTEKYGYHAFSTTPGFRSLYMKSAKSHGIENVAVVILPHLECFSPFTWVLLAHEYAHSIEGYRQISKTVFKDIEHVSADDVMENDSPTLARKWALCQEFCADLLTARVVGPSYFSALVEFFHLTLGATGFDKKTDDHPTPRSRIVALYNVLQSVMSPIKPKNTMIGSQYKLMALRWAVAKAAGPDQAVTVAGKLPPLANALNEFESKLEDYEYFKKIRPGLERGINQLGLQNFSPNNWRRGIELGRLLSESVPIGAYRKSTNIKKIVQAQRAVNNGTYRKDIYSDILCSFSDEASFFVDMATAAWQFRHSGFPHFLKELFTRHRGWNDDAKTEIREFLDQTYKYLRHSIATNEIHRDILKWRHDP